MALWDTRSGLSRFPVLFWPPLEREGFYVIAYCLDAKAADLERRRFSAFRSGVRRCRESRVHESAKALTTRTKVMVTANGDRVVVVTSSRRAVIDLGD